MSLVRPPVDLTHDLVAATTAKRTPLHNGQPASAGAISPIERAIQWLLSQPGRIRTPGVMTDAALTTAYQYWRLRVPVMPYCSHLAVTLCCSRDDTMSVINATVTTLKDATGATLDPTTWTAYPPGDNSPGESTAVIEYSSGVGAAVAPGYEDVVVGVKKSSAGANCTLHAIGVYPLRIQDGFTV